MKLRLPASLTSRINVVLGVSGAALLVSVIGSLYLFMITPLMDISTNDEAGLIVLSAKTWVELTPEARPFFEIELLEGHDLIITAEARDLPGVSSLDTYHELLSDNLSIRLGRPVEFMESDELLWVNVPMGGHEMQVGFSPQGRNLEPLYAGLVIIAVGSAIVFSAAAFLVRRVVRPVVAASSALKEFRGTDEFDPLPEEGPTELVTLAASINTMARDVSALLSNRTTLLAGISHDLRTPLARMRLAVELLPPEVDPELAERFERNLVVMDELIADALRLVRGIGDTVEVVELVPYLEGIAFGFNEEIRVDWPEDLPGGKAGRKAGGKAGKMVEYVMVQPGALRRVLVNLIDNGLRHGQTVAVRVEMDDRITIHVIDDGPGIPEEERDKVFRPFYRLEASRSRATGGSGLGLAIVHQLCEAHGWEVGLAEDASGGTDAYVSFPCVDAGAQVPESVQMAGEMDKMKARATAIGRSV